MVTIHRSSPFRIILRIFTYSRLPQQLAICHSWDFHCLNIFKHELKSTLHGRSQHRQQLTLGFCPKGNLDNFKHIKWQLLQTIKISGALTYESRVYFGIAQRGWGVGGNPCPNGLWQFVSESKPLLRQRIFIRLHQYLPWFPSEYHPRIMFDNSHCQIIHSQSQHRCLKIFLVVGEKYVGNTFF